jgi:hypothetical protein
MTLTATQLVSFLNGLREQHGFALGVREYLRAEQIRKLVAGHDSLPGPTGWIDYLAPVLCSSHEEQVMFRRLFADFADASPRRHVSTAFKAYRDAKTLPKATFYKSRLLRISLYLLLMLLVALILYRLFPSGRIAGSADQLVTDVIERYGKKQLLVLVVQFILPWTFFGLFLLWRHDTRPTLQRNGMAEGADSRMHRFASPVSRHFPLAQVARHLASLQRRWMVGATTFAIDDTIRLSARRAGFADPQIRRKTVRPRYLLLVRLQGRADHQGAAGLELNVLLQSAGIDVTTYTYANHPAFLTPLGSTHGQPEAAPLAAVLDADPEAIVMVVEDGSGLISGLTLELHPWALSLVERRRMAIVVSSAATRTWGVREQRLYNRGFLVVPCDGGGIVELCRAVADLQRDDVVGVMPLIYAAERQHGSGSIGKYPSLLQVDAGRFVARRSPPLEVVKRLVLELQEYLGREGFVWLAALAVYPELTAELTRAIGVQLARGQRGAVRFDSQTYLTMARLPWLVHGFMPDWLRRCVLDSVSDEDAVRVREALDQILAQRSPRGVVALWFTDPINFWKRAVGLLRAGRRQGDAVFVRFMSGSRTNLGVEAPDFLRAERRYRRRSLGIAVALFVAAATLSVKAVLGPPISSEILAISIFGTASILTAWNAIRAHIEQDTISRSGYTLAALAIPIAIIVAQDQNVSASLTAIAAILLETMFLARYALRGDHVEKCADELVEKALARLPLRFPPALFAAAMVFLMVPTSPTLASLIGDVTMFSRYPAFMKLLPVLLIYVSMLFVLAMVSASITMRWSQFSIALSVLLANFGVIVVGTIVAVMTTIFPLEFLGVRASDMVVIAAATLIAGMVAATSVVVMLSRFNIAGRILPALLPAALGVGCLFVLWIPKLGDLRLHDVIEDTTASWILLRTPVMWLPPLLLTYLAALVPNRLVPLTAVCCLSVYAPFLALPANSLTTAVFAVVCAAFVAPAGFLAWRFSEVADPVQ